MAGIYRDQNGREVYGADTTISGSVSQRTPNLSFRMPTTAASNNGALIKSSPGGVFSWQGRNASGSEYYLKFYNLNRVPVVGTDIPFATIFLPPQSDFPILSPMDFKVGIAMAITPTSADADSDGLVSAGDIVGLNIFYD